MGYRFSRSRNLARHYTLLLSSSLLVLLYLFFKDGQPEIIRGGFPYKFLKEYNTGEGRVSGGEGRHLLQEGEPEPVTLLLYIISAPDNVAQRAAIRETWLSEDWKDSDGRSVKRQWKHWFILGRPSPDCKMRLSDLIAEKEEHGDMLIADLPDSYHNLVLKTIFLLHHAKTYYNYQFLMKADDDTFLNIGLLLGYLEGKEGSMFFGGNLTPHPWRVDRQGIWRIPKQLWTPDITPKYHGGPGYVVSQPAVEVLLDVWDSRVQPLIFVEDIFMGALAHRSGTVQATLIEGWQTVSMTRNNCYHPQKIFLQHKLTGEDIISFMDQHRAGGHYCYRVKGVVGVSLKILEWVPYLVVAIYIVFVVVTHKEDILKVMNMMINYKHRDWEDLLRLLLEITNYKEIMRIVIKTRF